MVQWRTKKITYDLKAWSIVILTPKWLLVLFSWPYWDKDSAVKIFTYIYVYQGGSKRPETDKYMATLITDTSFFLYVIQSCCASLEALQNTHLPLFIISSSLDSRRFSVKDFFGFGIRWKPGKSKSAGRRECILQKFVYYYLINKMNVVFVRY